MTPEAQSNLFTPFFSTKPHGQGIGLTLVQEILAGHGFDYSLERTAAEHDAVHDRRWDRRSGPCPMRELHAV